MSWKMIGENQVLCTDDEEDFLAKLRKLEQDYPEYANHVLYDGIREPWHDMNGCKKLHEQLVAKEIQKKLEDFRFQYEEAEENYDEGMKNRIIAKRNEIRSHLHSDISSMKTIQDLKNHLEKIKDFNV